MLSRTTLTEVKENYFPLRRLHAVTISSNIGGMFQGVESCFFACVVPLGSDNTEQFA